MDQAASTPKMRDCDVWDGELSVGEACMGQRPGQTNGAACRAHGFGCAGGEHRKRWLVRGQSRCAVPPYLRSKA